MNKRVELTDDELFLLNGKCRPEIQLIVDQAFRSQEMANRLNMNAADSEFLREVVTLAENDKKVICSRVRLSSCNLCGKRKTYLKYKSGPKRGRDNYKRPIYLIGREFKDSFVMMTGCPYVGCCEECFIRLKPILASELSGIRAQISKEIVGEAATRYRRWSNRKCTACGWTGHEGQMGLLPAVMEGRYRGACPSCGGENKFLQKTVIEVVPGYSVAEWTDE